MRVVDDAEFRKIQALIGNFALCMKKIGIFDLVKPFPNFLPYMKNYRSTGGVHADDRVVSSFTRRRFDAINFFRGPDTAINAGRNPSGSYAMLRRSFFPNYTGPCISSPFPESPSIGRLRW